VEPRISLVPATEDDLDFLCRVYASTRTEELAATDWSAEQKAIFLRQQAEAQHRYYRESYAGASWEVVRVGDRPAGRLYLVEWERELRLIDIALLPEFRDAGVGSRLLARVMARAAAAGKVLSIHVERFNPALRLYARLGFQVAADDGGVYLRLEWTPPPAAARAGS
jgi:ribosomal protein S18 acetylase RimI-like enzyme